MLITRCSGFGVALFALSSAAFIASCAQVRAGGETPLTTVRIASGLTLPIYVTAAPGDPTRVFVLEKTGRIRVITAIDSNTPVLQSTSFLDIDARVGGSASIGGERGLLGLAFHPDYLNNGFFYVNYTNNSGDTRVSRFQVTGDPTTSNSADPDSELILLTFDQPQTNHNGGCLKFGPDNMLYIGSGDGGGADDLHGEFGNGQDTGNLLGNILRLNVDIAAPYIPADNPFVGEGNPLDEIWAYGLRNPWRFAFDRANGDLYITDVGQLLREEVNYISGGAGGQNYGWRCMEGNNCFISPSGPNCTCGGDNLTDPIHEYGHGLGCSITGGEVYRGCAIPDLQGTYFFADYCSASIWSFRVVGGAVTDFRVRTSELDPPGGLNIRNITSFGLDDQGEIYLCDQADGEVFKIVPQAGQFADCNANNTPDGCESFGEFDGIPGVGLGDHALLADELTGPGGSVPCAVYDSDGDGDADLSDWKAFLDLFGGN